VNAGILLDQGGEIGEKGSLKHPTTKKRPDEGLDDSILKALTEDHHASARKIAKAVNINSTTVRNHLSKSLEMKCDHMRLMTQT
jgi:DNA invertase Pin-like site-specific DNA recombinase